MKEGFDRKMKIQKELNMEGWRQTRLIAYLIARPNLIDKHLSLWNFMPLDGDPTADELIEIKQQEQNKQMDHAKAVHDNWKKKKYGDKAKMN
jgi:hypothetical protein